MTKTLRASSLAASLAFLSFSTMAAAVTLPTITFEGQAGQVRVLNAPVLANSTSEVRVENAWVYISDVGFYNADLDITAPADTRDTRGTYVVNRNRGGPLNSIFLELLPPAVNTLSLSASPSAATQNYLTSITVDLFARGAMELYLYDVSGNAVLSPELSTNTGLTLWSTYTSDPSTVTADKQINRMEFRGAAGVAFGLDNITISVSQGAADGTVPEPTSYALVAMALLAAGGASRQRKV